MRAVRVFAALAALVSSVGCNAQPGVEIDLGTAAAAITGACTLNQLGAPCDPDGTGPMQECQGVCALQASGGTVPNVRCLTLAAAGVTSNDGKLCGSSGLGAGNCNQVCTGTLCVAKPASNGTACRPGTGATDTLCDGQCQLDSGTGTSSCARITSACTIERPATGGFNRDCVWSFCSANNANTCVAYSIPSGTTCDDSNACTSGDRCDGAGRCVATTTKTCPSSGTPCLDNQCNPSTGACVANPTTAACKFDACFAGTCSGGTCNKGAAVDCDDGNACTIDSCDSKTGCSHAAKCVAPDACTITACDPSTGGCSNTPRSCDDGNPCTADSCNPTGGCVNALIPGCFFDAGVDVGPPPVDTGAPPPLDTGVPPFDSGIPVEDTAVVFDEGPIEEDSASPIEDTGVTPIDSAVSDSAAEAGEGGLGFEEDLSRGGCGCRTTGSSTSTSGLAVAGLMAAAIVSRRRRR